MFNTEEFDLHVNTIKSWIDSCVLPEQLDICQNTIYIFLVRKFGKSIDYFQMEAAVDFLITAIVDKKVIMASLTEKQRKELTESHRKQFQSLEPLMS